MLMMWLTPLKPSAVRLLGRPPPPGVRDFLRGKLRLLPDGTRGSALKDEMHGVIHYPLCASGACAINESYPLKPSLLHPQTTVAKPKPSQARANFCRELSVQQQLSHANISPDAPSQAV
ncbi:hypothetical protein HaLaN_14559 [Haematococcus lacustris]|uniref:Uncharacterized protein n=1 Tax=Haematococcus lacustris TaxID=44745 RepID=A0A699Z5D4_HAELA|nr:hypothetical protein HaLaN_14559 [Haematococcus lacustris]